MDDFDFDKQIAIIKKLHKEISQVDVTVYDKRYLFAFKTQQFYTCMEDLFKQIAKSFENHIETMSNFPKEILIRLSTEVPGIRPALLSKASLTLLDKVRAFRHFIRHAYDCELDERELQVIQDKLRDEFAHVIKDLETFRVYINKMV